MNRTVKLLALFLAILLSNRIRPPVFAEETPPETAYSVIFSALMEFQNTADVSCFEITPPELRTLYSSMLADHPEFFYADTSYAYTSDGSHVASVSFTYTMTPEEAAAARETVNDYVSAAISAVPDGSELEKALFLHDTVCRDFQYDPTFSVYNAFDLVRTGRGVCQAYTGLYKMLLTAAGIECKTVASREMSHIWNAAAIDGEWYNIDVTWDDSDPDIHKYFLKSDVFMSENGHYGFDGACVSGKYDSIVPGDLNGDGVADGRDVSLFRRSSAHTLESDVNSDGVTDDLDLSLLRKAALDHYIRIN